MTDLLRASKCPRKHVPLCEVKVVFVSGSGADQDFIIVLAFRPIDALNYRKTCAIAQMIESERVPSVRNL